jgi:hypothetical protein
MGALRNPEKDCEMPLCTAAWKYRIPCEDGGVWKVCEEHKAEVEAYRLKMSINP